MRFRRAGIRGRGDEGLCLGSGRDITKEETRFGGSDRITESDRNPSGRSRLPREGEEGAGSGSRGE